MWLRCRGAGGRLRFVATSSIELGPVGLTADGKAARRAVPRSSHAEWEAGGRDPLLVLAAQDEMRVPELVPLRYGRMLASPFAFFRGSAALMAGDLAETADLGLKAQLCGD